MRTLFLLAFLGLFGFSTCGQKDISKIEAILQESIEKNRFSGSLIITKQGTILYQKHAGLADRTWNVPISQNTKFDIASLNKSFIAALTLKAIEEGKFSLDSRLVDLLKSYNYSGTFHGEITIHQLLSHTSGLADYDGIADTLQVHFFEPFKRLRFRENADYINFISQVPPKGKPGQQFHYSNFAYHILPIILEDVYGKPFNDILQEKICEPLGLNNTLNRILNEDVISNLAIGYNYSNDTKSWSANSFIDLTLGRRIFSTAEDLHRWAQALAKEELLTPTSHAKLTTNHLERISNSISYGYGIVPFGANDTYSMGNLDINEPYLIHGGNTEGYRSLMVIINNGELILTLLTNAGNQLNELLFAQRLIKELLKD